jgi:hypothetical protein
VSGGEARKEGAKEQDACLCQLLSPSSHRWVAAPAQSSRGTTGCPLPPWATLPLSAPIPRWLSDTPDSFTSLFGHTSQGTCSCPVPLGWSHSPDT